MLMRNHPETRGLNPNYAYKGAKTYRLPAAPMLEASAYTLDLSAQGGASSQRASAPGQA